MDTSPANPALPASPEPSTRTSDPAPLPETTSFGHPQVLEQIPPELLRQLFDRFRADLRAKHPDLPDRQPDSHQFVRAVCDLLPTPEALPDRLRQALRAIEELAAPKNRQLLRQLMISGGFLPQPLQSPESLALEYYLRRPFSLDNFDRVRADAATPPLFGVPEPDEPEPPESPDGATQPPPSNRQPQASGPSHQPYVPGDLAALARFPRHKIARLPPEIRDSINRLLRQRVPYREIIPQLGEHGKALNKNNLWRWKKTGYLLWLQEQQKREDARAQLQLLLDLVRENDNGTIHEAAQQLAALKICYALAEMDLTALEQTLARDPDAFLRLVQALPKLSQGGMTCEQARVRLAERKIQLEKEKIPKAKPGISDEALRRAEEALHLL